MSTQGIPGSMSLCKGPLAYWLDLKKLREGRMSDRGRLASFGSNFGIAKLCGAASVVTLPHRCQWSISSLQAEVSSNDGRSRVGLRSSEPVGKRASRAAHWESPKTLVTSRRPYGTVESQFQSAGTSKPSTLPQDKASPRKASWFHKWFGWGAEDTPEARSPIENFVRSLKEDSKIKALVVSLNFQRPKNAPFKAFPGQYFDLGKVQMTQAFWELLKAAKRNDLPVYIVTHAEIGGAQKHAEIRRGLIKKVLEDYQVDDCVTEVICVEEPGGAGDFWTDVSSMLLQIGDAVKGQVHVLPDNTTVRHAAESFDLASTFVVASENGMMGRWGFHGLLKDVHLDPEGKSSYNVSKECRSFLVTV